LDEPNEDLDAYLGLMVRRCESERQRSEARVRDLLDTSYTFERQQIHQVGARRLFDE
jgi:hypothetical protein